MQNTSIRKGPQLGRGEELEYHSTAPSLNRERIKTEVGAYAAM